jgi:seryl-tRNA synthetase
MPQSQVKTLDIATQLKQIYGVNKNISNKLKKTQKEELLHLLENNDTVLAFAQALISKNNELANNNRGLGKRRVAAETELEEQREENKELNNEISQLKYELKALMSQLVNVINSFHKMLVNDMLDKSEIIQFTQKLLDFHK